ncbi:MAG: DNA polymerase III subunit delta [Nitrospirota bacterium]
MPDPVYLLYAADPFLCREAISEITKLVPVEEREFNLHLFDLTSPGEEDTTFDQVLTIVNTVSFFGSRRFTIAISNLQKLSKKEIEKLGTYISNPAPNSVLFLFHEGVLKKEMRDKFKKIKSLPLDMKEADIPQWIKQKVSTKGVKLSNEAVEYLMDLTGTDLGLLSSEIEKISLVGKKRVEVDDISDIVTGMKIRNVFDLVDALRKKDAESVFKIYRTLKNSSEDYSLVGALNWQYGRRLRPDLSPSEKKYYLHVFELLKDADIDMKSSGRNFPLEYLLFKLLRLP